MDTRKLRWTHRGVRTVAIFSWALLVIPATDARAITFGEWATNQGWPAGYVMPATVDASMRIHQQPRRHRQLQLDDNTDHVPCICTTTKSRASNRATSPGWAA